MQEQKQVSFGFSGGGVHLSRPAAATLDDRDLVTAGNIGRIILAPTVSDNDFKRLVLLQPGQGFGKNRRFIDKWE